VLGSALILGLMAYSLFGWFGVGVAVVIAIIGMASVGRVSPAMVLNLYKARPLATHEAPELHQMVRDLAKQAELPAVPKLYYVPTQIMNAFAVGRQDDSAIAVTDGLVRAMNLRQLNGILAHETAHIMNGDLRVMGFADVLNRMTSFLSTLGLMGIPLVFGIGVDMPLLGLGAMIFAPTLGGLLQLGLSRAREYDADLDGSTLTGDPEGLASALRVLEERQGAKWGGLILPGTRSPQPSLMRTHPKTEDRIRRLMALKTDQSEQIVVRSESMRPQTSMVPQVTNPRIRWHRLGVYY
jgi:heat shock protein HtpX